MWLLLASVFCAGVSGAASIAGQTSSRVPPSAARMHEISSHEASSSAFITSGTAVDHAGVHALALLVVWRGTAGWHSAPEARDGSGGATATWFEYAFGPQNKKLRVRYDAVRRVAEIAGMRRVLQDANVILVDNVDMPGGPRIVRTLRVDPAVQTDSAGRPLIEDVWRRSAEIVAFVQR